MQNYANEMISAAHCFHNPTSINQEKLPEAYFEVVVGKFTRDYDAKDNSYQKSFKVSAVGITIGFAREFL